MARQLEKAFAAFDTSGAGMLPLAELRTAPKASRAGSAMVALALRRNCRRLSGKAIRREEI